MMYYPSLKANVKYWKNNSMKTIVIFGATGAVGAYTTLHLLEKGYKVVAVGKRTDDNGFFNELGCEYISVDICNKNEFNNLPNDNIWGIIDLAGCLPANMEGYTPQKYIDINISGTLNILEYAVEVNSKVLIYSTSFSDVSHLWNQLEPIGSDVLTSFPLNNDHSIYSITKNAGADFVRHYSYKYNFKHFILRFPNIYLYHPNTYYFVNGKRKRKGLFNIIDQASNGEDIELWGSPNVVRDMVYVKDCCQIIEKCICSNYSGTYNVGTGVGTTREDQIKGIIEVFSTKKGKSKIVYKTDKPNSPQYVMDISKTKEYLGYLPEYYYYKSLQDLKKEMEINRFEKLWGKPEDYNL